jgi:peroxiredoxin
MFEFSLPNVDEKALSLADFPDAKGFVVVFTCNHCPYAIAYENRLIALHQAYAPQGYPVIAINANDPVKYPQDSFENMQLRAREKSFPFPYLFDSRQEVARAYQAERTPHVMVLQKDEEGELKEVYRGAIDDNHASEKQVKQTYLADVLDALLDGQQPPYRDTPAVGCSIKWK